MNDFNFSDEIESIHKKLYKEAELSGYHLNPDAQFAKDLVGGLIVNKNRYGYMACPCRLASGIEDEDLDIICPCDYRDTDLNDFGSCYCGLYVSGRILIGEKNLEPIPERRSPKEEREKIKKMELQKKNNVSSLPYPVYRCKVCGYLCAREHPPEVCPICKAKKDRFERFI